MAQRGRPRKNGAKPGGMLGREVIALGAYDEARRRGENRVYLGSCFRRARLRFQDAYFGDGSPSNFGVLEVEDDRPQGPFCPSPSKSWRARLLKASTQISSASLPSNCILSWAESSI